MTLVSINTGTLHKTQGEKTYFNTKLQIQIILLTFPQVDKILILNDFNASVGRYFKRWVYLECMCLETATVMICFFYSCVRS